MNVDAVVFTTGADRPRDTLNRPDHTPGGAQEALS